MIASRLLAVFAAYCKTYCGFRFAWSSKPFLNVTRYKFLKSIYLLVFFVCFGVYGSWAQGSRSISYQAIARDLSGQILANQPGTVRMAIIENNASSAPVYIEQHAVTTNNFGLFTLQIGNGTPGTGQFSDINWQNLPHFVRVEIDFGSGWANMGTFQLYAVPYALYAETAGNSQAGINSLVRSEVEPAGVNCPQGGRRVLSGLDINRNGILEPSEATQVFFVCDGQNGNPGAVGPAGVSVTSAIIQNDSLRVFLSNGLSFNAGFVRGATGPQGPIGAQGPTGLTGRSLLNGASNPVNSLGNDGDFFLNTNTNFLFGPKTAGQWPSTGISLIGPAGATGPVQRPHEPAPCPVRRRPGRGRTHPNPAADRPVHHRAVARPPA